MLARPPKPVPVVLNLAPMVDVMMCLIIFFLLASKLVSAQHRPLKLPFAAAAEEIERSELGARVVINVRPAEKPDEAEYVVQAWDGERIRERVLAPSEVADFLQARAAQASQEQQELRCVIRADKQVAYGHVELVLRGCGLARIAKVVFSANAGDDPEGPR